MGNSVLLCYENSVKSYRDFAFLVSSLTKYQYDKTDENKKRLDLAIEYSRGMPLPSGRWGNPLAVALEMRLYEGAKYIIEDAEKFDIDLNHVSSDLGGGNPWSAEEVYQLSVLKFDFNPIPEDHVDYKDMPSFIEKENQNKIAAEEVGQMLVKK